MKIAASILTAFVAGTISANAFVATHRAPTALAFQGKSPSSSVNVNEKHSNALKSMADELDIPCEDDCAIESYPNLPASVHPGVNTGQAMIDLLNHAKENGEL
jgi:hypothetical protein